MRRIGIKRIIVFAFFVIVLGSLTIQHDSAKSDMRLAHDEVKSAYFYVDFKTLPSENGLLEPLLNPETELLVVDYLTSHIGDPIIADALISAAKKNRLDPALVVAISWQESRFQAVATGNNSNRSIDRGLMQLNSTTFKHLNENDFFDPYLNADNGVSYLRKILQLSGNTIAALAMYNAGPSRVDSLGAPRQTLDYVSLVLAYQTDLIQGFYDKYSTGGILVNRDIKPLKNPDFL